MENNNKMPESKLICEIINDTGISEDTVKKIIKSMKKIIKLSIINGISVNLLGLCTFHRIKRKGKKTYNFPEKRTKITEEKFAPKVIFSANFTEKVK